MGCIQQIDALITGWHHWTNNTKNYFPSQFPNHVGAYCMSLHVSNLNNWKLNISPFEFNYNSIIFMQDCGSCQDIFKNSYS
jgi:hypothetical protein